MPHVPVTPKKKYVARELSCTCCCRQWVASRIARDEWLRQLQQLLQVVDRAVAALVADPDERRPLRRAEDHVIAADDEVALRIARPQRELASFFHEFPFH